MFTTLFSVALFSSLAIQGALADIAVGTPKLTQCAEVTWNWPSSTGPYNFILVPNADPCGDALVDSGDLTKSEYTVQIKWPAGTKLLASVEDANGDEGWSGEMTVQASNDASCLPAPTPDPSASASAADASGSAVPIGAANAGKTPFGGSASGALTMRQLSVPAMALSVLIAAGATFAL